MKYLVTGGAGFIGSNLAKALLERGDEVVVFDNLSSGSRDLISFGEGNSKFKFIEADLREPQSIDAAMQGIDFVFHLAANPDVRIATSKPDTDLHHGVIATFNVLDAMRKAGVSKIAFASSSVIYGESDIKPTPEDYGPLAPISLYGAGKLGAEAQITAFSHTFDFQVWIFRFANIIGGAGTHGVLYDFIMKLRKTPDRLEILGNGKQAKSYVLVEECVDAILFGVEHAQDQVNIYNIGNEDLTSVDDIAQIVVEEMGLEGVEFAHTGGERGWVGDIAKTFLSYQKLNGIGWKPKANSYESIRESMRRLLKIM
jgi:UDP-glucose 4-epimerase